ncbi:sensor domain-containing diguanylate cyclase [Virgibacillus pantothenticus]|uniref:sensor domain-containing diguanylate cyclase n=1 Tax=Virgibacillus pantothenticus TaxID=1473 RepID=UPI000986739F|nr:diguanylate cyclase [Virgibacillus pantothenticus]
MNLQYVRDHLQQAYDDLLRNILKRNALDNLSFIVKQIYTLNDVSAVCLYRWEGDFYERFILYTNTNATKLIPDKIIIEELENKQQYNEQCTNRYWITLNTDYLLLLTTTEPVGEASLFFIRSEILNMLDVVHRKLDEKTQYPFLYYLTMTLFTKKRKAAIVKIVINTFMHFYPKCKIQLLLSQDTNIDIDFPVESIAYNDNQSMNSSTKAFISGEVQIEKQSDIIANLFVPLTGNQGVYGVVQLLGDKDCTLTEREIPFVTNVAQTAGKAIENASLMEHSKHHISELKLINDVTHHLNSNLNLKEITEYIRDKIKELCQAQEIGFIFKNGSEDVTVLQASTDYFHQPDSLQFATFLLEQEKHATFHGNYHAYTGLPYRSLLVIPMEQGLDVYGVVVIMHPSTYFFSFEMFKFMQSLIQHCSLAFFNAILKEELQKAVITDDLTRLYSRKYLEEKIIQQREITAEGSLILFDIDDFKKVNDTYGHHVGDDVLKQVAEVIHQFSDHSAIPARWGGEELAIYTPNKQIAEAVALAGEVCNNVEKMTNPTVTLSCGVSTWQNDLNDSVSELFIRADRALYKAKQMGKNSVVQG